MKMLSLLCCAAVVVTGCDAVKSRLSGPKTAFDGNAALAYAKAQVDFGPRIPGTAAHDKAARGSGRDSRSESARRIRDAAFSH